ncbi:MAG TPA: sulfate adenylyltransferase [Pseudogracilibacillus sp.]|nr:sulfate adenylyltransferase [Pseudogracilibacillus sp.]
MEQKDIKTEDLNFFKYPQKPHGGKLVDQVLKGKKREEALERAATLPKIMVDMEAVITVEMVATGVLSPNDGFMSEKDYNAVLEEGRLADGTVWPVPLSFAPVGEMNRKIIEELSVGDEIVLIDAEKQPVAIQKLEDIFQYDKDKRASHLFGTTDRSHPGVDSIYRRMGDIALGGEIYLLNRADWGPFEKIRMEPKDTWHLFYEEKEFNTMAGFITGANPMHRGHEYIHKNALEEVDGVFIQPLVEMAKREYTRHEFRMLAYRSVIDNYYPKERSLLAPLRVTYIFAGPREAVLHALIMKNYGCTHALIGRDHAGVGDFYSKYEAHNIFDDYTSEELGIEIRLFHEVFYCTRCSSLASGQSCPHDHRYRINISGTGIRELLRHGILPPKEIVRPESARIAIQGVQPKGTDENDEAMRPVGKTIKSLFPFYMQSSRLGGEALPGDSLEPEQLTLRDLQSVILDVRANADKIYNDIYESFTFNADTNRTVQPDWRAEAREAMREQQEMVVADLEEKVKMAAEATSDEFMYQDKQEAERELEVAKRILEDMPAPFRKESMDYRVWNPLPYDRYRV